MACHLCLAMCGHLAGNEQRTMLRSEFLDLLQPVSKSRAICGWAVVEGEEGGGWSGCWWAVGCDSTAHALDTWHMTDDRWQVTRGTSHMSSIARVVVVIKALSHIPSGSTEATDAPYVCLAMCGHVPPMFDPVWLDTCKMCYRRCWQRRNSWATPEVLSAASWRKG